MFNLKNTPLPGGVMPCPVNGFVSGCPSASDALAGMRPDLPRTGARVGPYTVALRKSSSTWNAFCHCGRHVILHAEQVQGLCPPAPCPDCRSTAPRCGTANRKDSARYWLVNLDGVPMPLKQACSRANVPYRLALEYIPYTARISALFQNRIEILRGPQI